jgi:8-oxo-dGTP pyrophosphatase MutT (NUDIX family)
MASQPDSADGKAALQGDGMPPKRFKGDAHAVVAMIFRPASRRMSDSSMSSTSSQPADEQVEDVPVPVTIVPKEKCEEETHMENEPIEYAYDSTYWAKMQILVSGSEVFYILRSTNLRDRWSGQVGFPGGRKKPVESDLQAAARETFEEVGLELPFLSKAVHPSQSDKSSYLYLGRLNDRVVTQNNRRLVVSCLMYYQTAEKTPELTLAPSEVAACGWVPVQHFLRDDCATGMKVNLQTSFLGRKRAILSHLVRAMGVSSFVFVRVLLPVTDMHVSLLGVTDADREMLQKNFSLWGLTLGITSEMLVSTKLKPNPFGLKSDVLLDRIQVDRIFDSKAHNLGISAWTKVLESIAGQPLSWEQKVTSYMLVVVVGVPLTVAVSSAAYYLSSRM